MAAALAMAAGFTACSSDDDLQRHDAGGRTPITLTSSVATRAVDQNLQSTQIESGVQVGVYVTSGGQLIENGDNNRLTATGTGSFTGETMFFPEQGTVSVYAYAPYNSGWTGSQGTERTFTVPTDQSTDDGYLAADLMSGMPQGQNEFTADAPSIPLQFTHLLTKLNINFNTGDTGIDLKGATVSVLNVMPTTTFTVSTGKIGGAQGNATDIKAAVFATDATAFTASAIFVPQAVADGTPFVRVTLADGTSYDADLAELTDFAGSTKYNYTMNFSGGGQEPVEGSLVLESTVTDWADGGDLESGEVSESKAIGIGDYMLSDGTFVKSNELTDGQKSQVVAVVFSKQVSQADAEAGYNAYAMGLWRVKGKLGFEDVVTGSVGTFEAVLADIDGRTKTEALLASDAYAGLGDDVKGASMLGVLETYMTSHEVTEGVSSEWFIPAIGQLMQVVNNLGGAGININTEVLSNNWTSEWWTTENQSAINKINGYVTACGQTAPMPDGGAVNIASSTEAQGNLWGIQVRNKDGAEGKVFSTWGFGRGLNKNGQTDTSIIPCVAVKLP